MQPLSAFLTGTTSNSSNMKPLSSFQSVAQQQMVKNMQMQQSNPFNPKNPNSQFVDPKAPASSVQPGTSPASHIFSGTKDALGDIFVKPEQKLLADAGTRIAQAGTRAVEPLLPKNIQQNIDTNIQKPQHQLGVDIAPLGTGMEAVKQIGGQALNAVDAIGNVSLGESLVNPAIAGAKKTGNAIINTAQKTDVRLGGEAAQNAASTNAKTAATQAPKVAGQIVQGDIADIPKAQKALSQVDTSGVKTYQDLGNVLDKKIGEVSGLQDKAFDTRPEKINIQDLTSNGHNFVNDAIDQMREFYTKTNDVQGLKDLTILENKANTQGLSVKEVNQLAREHGAKLNGYNANGELASGLTKQAAENTRQGLKSTVRTFMGDKAIGGSDAQLSDLINTKKLVNEVGEKVNDLQQKIKERSLGEKIGYWAGKAFNTVGAGSPKGLFEYFLGRGTGLKTLNALDLEKTLQENLASLKELTGNNLSDADFTSKLNDIIKKGNPQKLLPEPAVGSPKSSNNVPINQPSKVVTPGQDIVPRSRVGIKPKYIKGGGKVTNIGPN